MPSPLGHALGGVAAGWTLAAERPRWRQAVLFGALGMAPDLDLLVRLHSMYTHSVGAALLVGVVAALIPPRTRGSWSGLGRVGFAFSCMAAYGSHILLDWLGSDSTTPIGVMALWPFSSAYYQSEWYVFDAISRRYWLPSFWTHNLWAALRELLILVPLVALFGALRLHAHRRALPHRPSAF